MRAPRRLLRIAAVLLALLTLAIVIPIAGIELGCRGTTAAQPVAKDRPAIGIDLPGYKRDEASTYFTFPEWYIVYASEDLADFVATHDESQFHYLSAIAGFWQSFCTIKRRTYGRAAPATDVSVMIYTIGLSFSAEFGIKGLYENTLGRLTEWLRGDALTDEDRFAHQVALDYAKFLYTIPWYKYPFHDRLNQLWASTPATGAAIVRKWERRFALSSEYAFKAGYGWVIQKSLDAAGDDDAREIMLVVRRLTADDMKAEPRIKVVKTLDNDLTLVIVPRYQVFSDIAVALSRKGRVIVEIAGNHNILMTAILPDGASPPVPGLTELFSMPLSARPGWRRAGFDVKVDDLTGIIPELDRARVAIEHLFDY